MKKIIKNLVKIFTFILLASLPFITMTQLIGIDTFLDSFENPDYYICIQDEENFLGVDANNGEYIVIQRASHPEFEVQKSDSVLYYNNYGDLVCNKIEYIGTMGAMKEYGITGQAIFEQRIVGKVINVIDGNIWNSISIRIWDTSINTLNLRALLTEN